jgi:hypothetical protein
MHKTEVGMAEDRLKHGDFGDDICFPKLNAGTNQFFNTGSNAGAIVSLNSCVIRRQADGVRGNSHEQVLEHDIVKMNYPAVNRQRRQHEAVERSTVAHLIKHNVMR